MAVCKFFLQGNCRFGDRCKFEHPRNTQHQNQGGRNNQGPNNARNSNNAPRQPNNAAQPHRDNHPSRRGGRDPEPYGVRRDELRDELTVEKPQWIMSAFGPGKNPPIQLFGGFPMELSPEEARYDFYLHAAAGNVEAAKQNEANLAQQSAAQVNRVLEDVGGALRYLQEGGMQHPNRVDVCQSVRSAERDVFSRQNTRRQAQRRPDAPPPPPMFRTPAFSGNAGNAPNSFGSPQPQPGNFGQPQATSSGGFGQPANSFGGPAGFGASNNQVPEQAMNDIPQTPTQASGFGVPMPQQSNATNASLPFGQPAVVGGFASAPGFGNTIQTPNTFQSTGFGGGGGNTYTTEGAKPPSGSFGQANEQAPPAVNGGFGQAAPALPAVASGPPSNHAVKGANGALVSWKGQAVRYEKGNPYYVRPDGKGLERIWLPNGRSNLVTDQGTLPEQQYPAEVREMYENVARTGTFPNGIVPEIPPRPEWTSWAV